MLLQERSLHRAGCQTREYRHSTRVVLHVGGPPRLLPSGRSLYHVTRAAYGQSATKERTKEEKAGLEAARAFVLQQASDATHAVTFPVYTRFYWPAGSAQNIFVWGSFNQWSKVRAVASLDSSCMVVMVLGIPMSGVFMQGDAAIALLWRPPAYSLSLPCCPTADPAPSRSR